MATRKSETAEADKKKVKRKQKKDYSSEQKQHYKEIEAAYKSLTKEQVRKNVVEALDNPFTDDISQNEERIKYTGEFYVRMKQLISEGMTDVEAYAACGYDPRKLGCDRAHKAAKQAVTFSRQETDWRSYSGMITPDPNEIEDKDVLIAQLMARVTVLEAMTDTQKKILSLFEEKSSASNPKK